MTYALIGVLLALVAFQRWDHGRQQSVLLAHVRELTDQIVLLKVSPPAAAALAASDVELPEVYINPVDDAALAEYELERAGK